VLQCRRDSSPSLCAVQLPVLSCSRMWSGVPYGTAGAEPSSEPYPLPASYHVWRSVACCCCAL
jgi:hypothetical protein